jgi:hypothetical protein
MDDVKVYEVNDTMQLLGHQRPAEIITEEARKQMGEITAARKYTTTFVTAMDMFTLGYIYGKRAERARRKKGAV